MSDPDGFDVCPLCGYNKCERIITEFLEDIDNILHADEDDWREILETLKEEYKERREKE